MRSLNEFALTLSDFHARSIYSAVPEPADPADTSRVSTDTADVVEAAGHFRIYLGAAAGVGKTFAMLNEGRRRHGRGADVVIGFVECHGRQQTQDCIGGLEAVPRKTTEYRGGALTEMDLDAVLRRRPRVALVDELAQPVAAAGRVARAADHQGSRRVRCRRARHRLPPAAAGPQGRLLSPGRPGSHPPPGGRPRFLTGDAAFLREERRRDGARGGLILDLLLRNFRYAIRSLNLHLTHTAGVAAAGAVGVGLGLAVVRGVGMGICAGPGLGVVR